MQNNLNHLKDILQTTSPFQFGQIMISYSQEQIMQTLVWGSLSPSFGWVLRIVVGSQPYIDPGCDTVVNGLGWFLDVQTKEQGFCYNCVCCQLAVLLSAMQESVDELGSENIQGVTPILKLCPASGPSIAIVFSSDLWELHEQTPKREEEQKLRHFQPSCIINLLSIYFFPVFYLSISS